MTPRCTRLSLISSQVCRLSGPLSTSGSARGENCSQHEHAGDFLRPQPLGRTVVDEVAPATAGATPTSRSSADVLPAAHTASAPDAGRCETPGNSSTVASGTRDP